MWLSRILKSITFFLSYAQILGTIDGNTMDWLHKNYNVNLSYPYMSIDGSELLIAVIQWVTPVSATNLFNE